MSRFRIPNTKKYAGRQTTMTMRSIDHTLSDGCLSINGARKTEIVADSAPVMAADFGVATMFTLELPNDLVQRRRSRPLERRVRPFELHWRLKPAMDAKLLPDDRTCAEAPASTPTRAPRPEAHVPVEVPNPCAPVQLQ